MLNMHHHYYVLPQYHYVIVSNYKHCNWQNRDVNITYFVAEVMM